MADAVGKMIEDFERALEGLPDYARNLIALGETALAKSDRLHASELARKAMIAAPRDPEVRARATEVLGSLVPRYHVPMMNDTRRNMVWDAALRNAIRPGMHVLEIGTGGGMLAMMAARAGAGKVITCERDPVAAALAREIVALNGYGEIVEIIEGRSQAIRREDLEQPAEVLFCDIFSDTLLGFDPLPVLADARRLLVPGAPFIPGSGTIRLALANWEQYARLCQSQCAAGFDITPFADLARASRMVSIGDPGLTIHSTGATAFGFDFSAERHPAEGRAELDFEIVTPGEVNGFIQWIRLEFGGDLALESRPEPGAVSFSAPRFHPLAWPVAVRQGDRLRASAGFRARDLMVWPDWE